MKFWMQVVMVGVLFCSRLYISSSMTCTSSKWISFTLYDGNKRSEKSFVIRLKIAIKNIGECCECIELLRGLNHTSFLVLISLCEMRNTCMVREHHVTVPPANHVSAFCMRLCVSGGSYVKYTYMIGQDHSYVVLPNHGSVSLVK